MTDNLEKHIGRFRIAATTSKVKAFCDAIGVPFRGIPLTFPVTFLAREDIAAALAAGLPPNHVPIHRSQSFTRHAPLQLDETYWLDLLRGPANRRALSFIIEARLSDTAGRPMQEFQTTFILKNAADNATS